MELTIPCKESISETTIEGIQDHHEYIADPDKLFILIFLKLICYLRITSNVLYTSRNKTGICIECSLGEEMNSSAGYALFDFTFNLQSENPDLIYTGKLRIALENMIGTN